MDRTVAFFEVNLESLIKFCKNFCLITNSRPFFLDKLFIVFCNFLFIFKIVKRHRAFRIWRSKNLYIIIIIINSSAYAENFY